MRLLFPQHYLFVQNYTEDQFNEIQDCHIKGAQILKMNTKGWFMGRLLLNLKTIGIIFI